MESPKQRPPTPSVDVVVVSYCSRATLPDCVAPLADDPGLQVIVVDNASPDDSLESIAGMGGITAMRAPRNGGFSYGCNLGAARGTAPYILFLNPDAQIDPADIRRLVEVAASDERVGLVAPRILDEEGRLAWSLRRFPQARSTIAQALFLHRLWPKAPWADELIRDPSVYAKPGELDWVSGACMLVPRGAFEAVGGFDEDFFLYCEDTDLCRRLWSAGMTVRFEPNAEVRHIGGASSAAGATQAIAARSRLIYARKHDRPAAARLQTFGVGLGSATHAIAALSRPGLRRGHMAALRMSFAGPAGAQRLG